MQIKQFVADGSPQRIEVQTNVSTLQLTIRNSFDKVALTAALAQGITIEDFVAKVVMDKLGGTVTISRYSNNGTKPLVTNIPLNALMEINAFGKGVIKHDFKYFAEDDTFVDTTCIISLSNFGAVRADKTNFIVMEYSNPIQADQAVTIDAVSSYMSYNQFLAIDTLTTQDNQITNFSCEEHYMLVIPSSASKVRIDCKAGDSLELTNREIKNVQLMTTDDIHNVNGRVLKSLYWDAIDVAQAYRGELLTPAKSNFYLLSNKGYA